MNSQGRQSFAWSPSRREDAANLRGPQSPGDSLPSGIFNSRVRAGDHLALVALDSSELTGDVVLDFVAAGIETDGFRESVLLELSAPRKREDVIRRLSEMVGREIEFADVEVRDWLDNSSDYELETFTRLGVQQAITREKVRYANDPRPVYRCVSEDCSYFMRWISNAAEYLKYERYLASDLRSILDKPFLQLCTFRIEHLKRLSVEQDVSVSRSLYDILRGHNVIVVVKNEVLLTGTSAVDTLTQTILSADSFGLLMRWATRALGLWRKFEVYKSSRR